MSTIIITKVGVGGYLCLIALSLIFHRP